MEWFVILIVIWACLIGLGLYVADQKGRSSGEGLLLTILFGPFGVLVLILLPNIPKADRHFEHQLKAIDARAEAEHVRDEILAGKQARRLEMEARRERLEEIAEERARRRQARRDDQIARGITPGLLSFLEEASVFLVNWYKSRSDLVQAILMGLMVAIPAGAIAIMVASRHR